MVYIEEYGNLDHGDEENHFFFILYGNQYLSTSLYNSGEVIQFKALFLFIINDDVLMHDAVVLSLI
jgi:hypothetical protein